MNSYQVNVFIVFESPGETYRETFVMEGENGQAVYDRVRLMLDDPRYGIVVRKN